MGSTLPLGPTDWGKGVQAFDQSHPLFVAVQTLGRLRRDEPPLSYGRLYFREVSGNGQDFGLSKDIGGVLAFSRILAEREVLIVSNTNTMQQFQGWVVVDLDLGRSARTMQVTSARRAPASSRWSRRPGSTKTMVR
jgi:hypothetical protein